MAVEKIIDLLKIYTGIGMIIYHQQVGAYIVQYVPQTGEPILDSAIQSVTTTVLPIFLGSYLIYDAGRKNRVW